MATYLPPSARMRQIKDAARASLEVASKKAPAPVAEAVAAPEPVAEAPTPVPETPQYDASMKKADLLAIAEKAGVEVPDSATKAQIIALLDDHFAG